MLTDIEMEKIELLNAKNHWGISSAMMGKMVATYFNAVSNGNVNAMDAIEYRLTDCNFHSECEALQELRGKRSFQHA